jgi:hypothetical protein
MFVCETCKESVDLSDPDVVYAVEVKEALRFIGTEEVEGRGVYFHEECFPWDDPAYREKLRPEVVHEVS